MIVGVAMRNELIEIRLPKPNRHHHCFAELVKLGVSRERQREYGVESLIGSKADNQGFYTDKGRYLNRKQAFIHAKRCNQIIDPQANKILFSEDVW